MSEPDVRQHSWDLTPKQAIALQKELRPLVETRDRLGTVRSIAGVDVGFEQQGKITRAAVAVLTYPGLEPVEQAVARLPTRFPYIPGLLSFREIPALLEALVSIRTAPDLLFCDGQGIAHPRRMGIASHLGLLVDIPAIGIGKTRLVGSYDEPPQQRGEWTLLHHKDETVGAVLRTRVGVKPIFVSPGHRIGLETAVHYVMACTPKFRLPEPIRCAHRLASGP